MYSGAFAESKLGFLGTTLLFTSPPIHSSSASSPPSFAVAFVARTRIFCCDFPAARLNEAKYGEVPGRNRKCLAVDIMKRSCVEMNESAGRESVVCRAARAKNEVVFVSRVFLYLFSKFIPTVCHAFPPPNKFAKNRTPCRENTTSSRWTIMLTRLAYSSEPPLMRSNCASARRSHAVLKSDGTISRILASLHADV